MKRISCKAFLISFCSALSLQAPVLADTYTALCNGIECLINIDGKGFTGPKGFIPAHRIAQWYTGGGEEHNSAASAVGATGGAIGGAIVGAAATCWTIILCPIGLLGGGIAGGMGGSGAGKSADFYFTLVGYNQAGEKIIQPFNFINKKPAQKMMQELPVMAGLGMGEIRSMELIKAADESAAATGTGRPQLPSDLNVKPAYSRALALPASLNSADTKNSFKSVSLQKCWSEFILKPGNSVWIESNPEAAQQLKGKYNDC
ncbi:MAG: hypothetical protein O2839_06600 [Cyanobacteria bacterium]|nr:hypothetical protein [Cyanobacteriota bacterium]